MGMLGFTFAMKLFSTVNKIKSSDVDRNRTEHIHEFTGKTNNTTHGKLLKPGGFTVGKARGLYMCVTPRT